MQRAPDADAVFICLMNMQRDTLSETNIAPENRPFPKESSHPSTIVEGYVRFRECLDDIVKVLNKEKHL